MRRTGRVRAVARVPGTPVGLKMVRNVYRLLRRSVTSQGIAGTVASMVRVSLDRRIWRSSGRADGGCEFDRKFGTDTGAFVVQIEGLDTTSPNWIHSTRYRPTPATVFHKLMAALPIRHEEFTFIDFGSGKGRVLLLASEFPFKAIVGIEFSRDLHEVAQRNVARYKSLTQACTRIDCLLLDATLYDVPLGPKVCFFFNPFHEPVMVQVVRRLEASLIAAPSPMFILYYRPALQHIFRDSKYFRELRTDQEYAIYQSTLGAG